MSLNYNPQPQYDPAYGQKPFSPSKLVSWLTPEQIASLRKNMPEFTPTIPAEEYVRAQCNHVDSNGNFAAVPTADNEYRCTICGAKFSVNPISDQDINKAVKIVTDALELTKLAYGNCPDNAKEFFAMIPLLKKLPSLYEPVVMGILNLGVANTNKFINSQFMNQRPQSAPGLDTDEPLASAPVLKLEPWLTIEQIASLCKSMPELTLTIPAEEYVRAQCNHVDSNGNFAAVQTADNEYRCNICGVKFSIIASAPALPPAPVLKVGPWLTPEQIAALRKSSFGLMITEEYVLRARCNHVDLNGNFAAVPTADNEHRCTICDAKFSINPIDKHDIDKAVKIVADALELTKLAYGNCPDNAKEFFIIIPLLKKIPSLYEIAMANLDKFEAANSCINSQFIQILKRKKQWT